MKLNALMCCLLAILSTPLVQAEVAQSKNDSLDERLSIARPSQPQSLSQAAQKTSGQTLNLSKQELANRPDLIVRALIPAVLENNANAVKLLLPLYQNVPQQDPFLLQWAQAIDAREQGQYELAIRHYRRLFAQAPENLAIRYQLAQALFLNNDNEAAQDQFQKLRATQQDPENLRLFDAYLNALNQRDRWKISGGLSFLNESNINNAPKAGTRIGNWQSWERESARGLSYSLNVEKKWSLANHLFSKVLLEGNGKYYWDNKKYNEFTARVGVGLGYQNARTEFSAIPFTERRWYAGGSRGSKSLKRYSQNSGLRLELNHWLNPQWQYAGALEYGEQRYVARKHLNGNNYLWSNTLIYYPQNGQYWFAGVDYSRENTRDADNAYQRKNVRLGWGQEWSWGISTRVSLGYARRTYKGADLFQIRQKNNEYGGAFSIWHRDLYFGGITPRLTWAYQKIDSNHPFYSYDKNRIYLEMSKTF
jgi:chromosomal replication initiation protein